MAARLGLGLAALGRPGYVTLNHASDLGGRYDPSTMELRTHDVLDAAFDAGIRYFDAARSYGRAEGFLASWLQKREIDPGEVMVASKWGYTYTARWSTSAAHHEIKDHSLRAFERQLSESLDRLGQYLSLYQIHSVTAESKTLEDDALIDAIARLRERGIRVGLTVSGPGQDLAIRRSLEHAHAAGMKIVVKESLANGRLTEGNRQGDGVFSPPVARIRELGESRGTTIETLALAAVLTRPWANVVLSGAATVEQIRSNVAALELPYDNELEEELRSVCLTSAEYWRARSSFKWN
jgi:aryl-alcohol dehydrogenase-like predicted oxidoreductase